MARHVATEPARGHDERLVSCEHASGCGGCPAIAQPYGDQLAMKRARVVGALGRYTQLEMLFAAPVEPAEPIVAYRGRAKLIVAPGGHVGLFARGGGHQVVDIPGCRVVTEPVAEAARAVRERLRQGEAENSVMAAVGSCARGAIRAIDVREARDERGRPSLLVTLVVQRDKVPSPSVFQEEARKLREACPLIVGVAVSAHSGANPQVLGSETTVVDGASSVVDRHGASMHLAAHGSFVQAHRGQAERIHRLLLAELAALGPTDRPPRVLDLYGGSGVIALALAGAGAHVDLVESFGPAAERAREAARLQALQVTVSQGDVARELQTKASRGERFDLAVVNPPRRGMSPHAREMLARLSLRAIAYVSCDPDTLARDLDHFARLGFTTERIHPFDMIPLTEEVETVAILRASTPSLPRVLYEDDEVVVVDKEAHAPTTPQGEYRESLFTRVRALRGAEQAVPVHRLDVGTSGIVLFAKSPDALAPWTAALNDAAARKIYLAAVRGIAPAKGTISRDLRDGPKVQPARTRYRRLSVMAGHSVVRVLPDQGRTHQIRRHLASIGHPVLGDERYGHEPTNRYFEEKHSLDRTFVHCVRVEIVHPRTGARLLWESPLPGDLRTVLERAAGRDVIAALEHKHALGSGPMSSMPPSPSSHDATESPLDLAGGPSLPPPGLLPRGDDDL